MDEEYFPRVYSLSYEDGRIYIGEEFQLNADGILAGRGMIQDQNGEQSYGLFSIDGYLIIEEEITQNNLNLQPQTSIVMILSRQQQDSIYKQNYKNKENIKDFQGKDRKPRVGIVKQNNALKNTKLGKDLRM